ncbi:MAG: hypothetical protein Q4C82_01185 [Eubacteriales bacterium]|nr:hypothetical protein [Eubacteriales bacterium]
MKKATIQFYVALTVAQILALLYDTVFQSLQRQAGAWFQVRTVLVLRYIPLFVIGILLALCAHAGEERKGFGVLGVLLFNAFVVVYHQYVFLLYDFIGVSIMTGFCAGAVILKLLSRR